MASPHMAHEKNQIAKCDQKNLRNTNNAKNAKAKNRKPQAVKGSRFK
jgi:hypothetical protein